MFRLENVVCQSLLLLLIESELRLFVFNWRHLSLNPPMHDIDGNLSVPEQKNFIQHLPLAHHGGVYEQHLKHGPPVFALPSIRFLPSSLPGLQTDDPRPGPAWPRVTISRHPSRRAPAAVIFPRRGSRRRRIPPRLPPAHGSFFRRAPCHLQRREQQHQPRQ